MSTNEALLKACKLTLLFHSGRWDYEAKEQWANWLTDLLGNATSRDAKIVGANGDGTWDGATPTNEATTKNLCNAQRAAIAAAESAPPSLERELAEALRMVTGINDDPSKGVIVRLSFKAEATVKGVLARYDAQKGTQ